LDNLVHFTTETLCEISQVFKAVAYSEWSAAVSEHNAKKLYLYNSRRDNSCWFDSQ